MKTKSQTKAEAIRTHNMTTRSQANLEVVFTNIKRESEHSEPNLKKLTEYAAIIKESLSHDEKNSYFEFFINKLSIPEGYKKLEEPIEILENLLLKLEMLPGKEVHTTYHELSTSVMNKETVILQCSIRHANSNPDIPVAGESEQQIDLSGD